MPLSFIVNERRSSSRSRRVVFRASKPRRVIPAPAPDGVRIGFSAALAQPQDPLLQAGRGKLLLVADGMGGVAGGDKASRLVVKAAKEAFYDEEQDLKVSEALARARMIAEERQNSPTAFELAGDALMRLERPADASQSYASGFALEQNVELAVKLFEARIGLELGAVTVYTDQRFAVQSKDNIQEVPFLIPQVPLNFAEE